MGATLDEACLAVDTYISNTGSATHPGKRTRIAAIVNGWKETKEDTQVDNIKEVASPN